MIKCKLRQYNRKAIVCGNVAELYEYEKPYYKGYSAHKHTGRASAINTTQEIKDDNRRKTAVRAKKTVKRTANANSSVLKKFVTLTFAENLTDIDKARYELEKFIKRLNSRYKKLEYIVVVEFQERGAIHFHMLCNLTYIPCATLEKIWGNGYIKVNKIDNVDNIGAYITKYMTKDGIDERLIGRKCYSMSKGLKKSIEINENDKIDDLLERLDSVKRVYSTEFESEYYGKITYTQVTCYDNIKTKLILEQLPDDTPCPWDKT